MKRSGVMAQSTSVEGRTIGRYRVRRHLATGGMAEIYLADYDDRGETRVAVVKVILRERARDRKFVQMFLDEARIASTLLHPNIAQLYEVGRDGDTYFYAMEYVPGDNVRALIERSLRARVYMPVAVTLAIGTRVAAALHYAHERPSASGQQLNAVHRDVTPANIMLGFDGSVKLLDFGIARSEGRVVMTQSGTVKGKFAYMSPEQCLGLQVDRRTDVFALGIVLYEVSTQRRAFRAESDYDTMQRIIRGDLVPPSRIHSTYPRELEAVLLKALSTESRDRYQTAAEFGQALLGAQRALAVTADERAVAEIAAQLFAGGTPAPQATSPGVAVGAPRAPAGPAPAMSLASMLAATVDPEPMATPAWSRPLSTMPPGAPSSLAAPMTTLVGTLPPPSSSSMLAEATQSSAAMPMPAASPTAAMMAVPAPLRGRRPATGPNRAMPATGSAFPSAEGSSRDARAAAVGTPASMAQVTPEDELAAAFARSSSEISVVALDEESTGIELQAVEPDDEPTNLELRLRPPPPRAPAPAPASALPPSFARSAPAYVPPSAPAYPPTPAPASAPLPTPVPMIAPAELQLRARPTGTATTVDHPDPERDRLGLWLALAAIFAVGAVVAAVLVFSSIGM